MHSVTVAKKGTENRAFPSPFLSAGGRFGGAAHLERAKQLYGRALPVHYASATNNRNNS